MRTSPNGIQFIKDREGFSPQAYWDVSQYSIGYGHKIHGGDGLTPRSVITENQATQLLYTDLAQVENVIKKLVTVALSQGQFDALSDFVYNLGAGNFQSSTLLQKLNAGDYAGAAEEFKRWIYAGGKPSVNLISRRTAEANIFTGIA
ncbi:MAG: lysozyme [Patescibacteria group bacterium]|nr:lysozyme [Patescibacteria group bacterium]